MNERSEAPSHSGEGASQAHIYRFITSLYKQKLTCESI